MRDYTNFEKHLEEIGKTIYVEPQIGYHEQLTKAAMEQFINGKPIKDVLDVGFGTGYAMKLFGGRGMNVTGISLDDSEINGMKFHGFNVKKMDMAFLDFPNESFDLLWCRHTLEHSVMPFIALMEFQRVMRPGAHLYIELPSDSGIHVRNNNHFSLLSDQMWQSLFKKLSFVLLFRGQFAITFPDMDDIYWHYWLKKNEN